MKTRIILSEERTIDRGDPMDSSRPSPSGEVGPINQKSAHFPSQPGSHPPPQRPSRGRRRPAHTRTAKDVQREYELYRRQAVLLLGTASLSVASARTLSSHELADSLLGAVAV